MEVYNGVKSDNTEKIIANIIAKIIAKISKYVFQMFNLFHLFIRFFFRLLIRIFSHWTNGTHNVNLIFPTNQMT